MTIAAVEDDPYLLPLPGPDTPVIPDHLIVGSSNRGNARYRDDHWPLDLMSANPSSRAVGINWGRCPAELVGEVRLAAWNLINGQLRPTFMRLKASKRQRMRARVGMAHQANTVHVWQNLATWLSQQRLTSLADCGTDVLDAFARHLVDGGATRRKTKEALAALTRLWAFDQLSAAPTGIGKPRWEDVGIDDYLPAASSGHGENSTEPLDETTMGPLLVWAMRVVDDFADDILAGRAEHQRLVQAAKVNGGTPQGRKALESYLAPQVDAGIPLPSIEHKGQMRVARTYIAGSTGASVSQVDEFVTRYGGRSGTEPQAGGRCPLAVTITGRIGERPWAEGIDFGEAMALGQHLATAAFIVVAYLTGMRPQESWAFAPAAAPIPSPGPPEATADTT